MSEFPDYSDCTEKCAAMPACTVCGMKKHPRGRDPGVEAASGFCGYGCPGNDLEPRAGHLWPNEWHDEVERRAAKASDEAEAQDREAQQREEHDADLYEQAQLDKLDARKNGDHL